MDFSFSDNMLMLFLLGFFAGSIMSILLVKMILSSKLKKLNDAFVNIQKRNLNIYKTSKTPEKKPEKKSAASVFLKHLNRLEKDAAKRGSGDYTDYIRYLNKLLSDNGIDKII